MEMCGTESPAIIIQKYKDFVDILPPTWNDDWYIIPQFVIMK
jgi:hypothetical protein